MIPHVLGSVIIVAPNRASYAVSTFLSHASCVDLMHQSLHLCLYVCSDDRVAHTSMLTASSTHAEKTPVFSLATGLQSDEVVTSAELWPACHDAYVFLDRSGPDSFTLTHVRTLERVQLQGLGWHIVNEQGMYAVCRGLITSDFEESDDDEPEYEFHLVETLLKRQLSVNFKGELFIKWMNQCYSLDLMRTRFRESTFAHSKGVCKLNLKVYWFVVPRSAGLKGYWDLHELYQQMGLEQYGRVAAHWVNRMAPSWTKLALAVFGACHLVGSSAAMHNTDATSWPDSCLPHRSCSTAMLILLTAVWSTASPRAGGFRGDVSKAAAHAVFEAMLVTAQQHCGSHLDLKIIIEEAWRSNWPRPSPYGPLSVTLPLKDLQIDLTKLKEQAHVDQAELIMQRYWLATVGCASGDDKMRVQVKDLLMHLHLTSRDKNVAWAFVAQICLQIAKKLEAALKDGPAAHEDDDSWNLEWRPLNESETVYQMDHQLVRYVLASRVLSERARSFVLATDGHDGCGPKLLNTVIGLPSNLCIVAVPQVR